MKKIKKYFAFLLLISIVASACNQRDNKNQASTTESEPGSTSTPSPNFVDFTKKNSIEKPGIRFSQIMIDTLTEEDKRVKLTFTVEMDSIVFTKEHLRGFDGFLIDVKCSGKNQKGFCLRKRTDYTSNYIPANAGFIFSAKDSRTLTANIPIRSLELDQGNHSLDLEIIALPIRFQQDTSFNRVRKIAFISDKPVASIEGTISIVTPQLHKVALTVHSLAINKDVVDIHKFDFALGGSGLPDLFWNVHCGTDFIYNCPVQKNAITLKKAYTSTPFLCSDEDWITIGIYDFDNGPFNVQDDVVEVWKSRISDFKLNQIDTLSFGNLSHIVLQLKQVK